MSFSATVQAQAPVEQVEVSALTVPTDLPESDGTLAWEKTTLVVVEITAGGRQGLGYTYADSATAQLIRDKLAGLIEGQDATAAPAWTGRP
jgi:hypothetical protein